MSYSLGAVDKVFADLCLTQPAIQSSSAKLVFWKRHADEIVQRWDKAFREAEAEKRLALIYLANDVVQVSKPKGRQFLDAFNKLLPEAFKHMVKHSDADVQQKLVKLVNVWRDRSIWGRKVQAYYDALLKGVEAPPPSAPHASTSATGEDPLLSSLRQHSTQAFALAQRSQALAKAHSDAAAAAGDAPAQVGPSATALHTAALTLYTAAAV